MLKTFGLFLLFTLIFAGCAHQAHQPCQEKDWYEIGRQDGAVGVPETHYNQRTANCSNPTAQTKSLYNQGRNAGLVSYCSPINAFELGKSDAKYHKVCPDNLEPDFLRSYHKGRKFIQLQNKNAELGKELRTLDEKISDQNISDQEKSQLSSRAKKIKRELASKKKQIQDLSRN